MASVCLKDDKVILQHPPSAAQVKWVSYIAAIFTLRFESYQANANTCLDHSVLSHSMWLDLETPVPLTLLTVNYGPKIIGGEDIDGFPLGTGAELSGYSAIPGKYSDIQWEP